MSRVDIINRVTGYVIYPTFVGLCSGAIGGLLPWWPIFAFLPILVVGLIVLIVSTRRSA